MIFDTNNKLWSFNGRTIFSIDDSTQIAGIGSKKRVTNLSGDYQIKSLFFDATGSLFAILRSASSILGTKSFLATIDLKTGEVAFIGETGFEIVDGLILQRDVINSVNIDKNGTASQAYVLRQNYPNPFNPNTIIEYELSVASYVEISIFDILGKQITFLVDKKEEAGFYKRLWDGKNIHGEKMASGVYFCRMVAKGVHGKNSYTKTRKMLLLR